MEREVPRPGASIHGGERRRVGLERASRGIKAIDQKLVQAKIGSDGEAVVGGKVDGMGVRARLAFGIDAGTCVLYNRGGFFEPALSVQGQNGHTAAPVVR